MSFLQPCMYPSVLASLSWSKSFGSRRISHVTIDTRDYLLSKISKKDVTGPCNLCFLHDVFFATARSVLLNCQDSCCLSLKGSSWISLQSSMARAAKQTHSITPELMLRPGTAAHAAILNLKTDKQQMPSQPVSDDLWISILPDRWHCGILLFLYILDTLYSRIGFLLLDSVVPWNRWRRLLKLLFPSAKDTAMFSGLYL